MAFFVVKWRPATASAGASTSASASTSSETKARENLAANARLQRVGHALEVDHVGEDLVERAVRAPAEELLDLGHVRHAPRHVLEVVLERVLVRDQLDLRLRVGHLADALGELPD